MRTNRPRNDLAIQVCRRSGRPLARPDVTRSYCLNKTPGDRVVSHALPGMIVGEGAIAVEPHAAATD